MYFTIQRFCHEAHMSATTYMTDAATLGTGLLLARLILGVLMVAHGGQKLFGWLGGYGIDGTAGFFEQLGFRPGWLFVITASLSEVVSGILIALGLFGPVGPALLLSVMIVAAVSAHWKGGLFAATSGI
jgi:putative oxidoreductase